MLRRFTSTPISRRLLLGVALAAAAVAACGDSGDTNVVRTKQLTPGPPSFDSGGVRIHYEIAGSGHPMVVLHGWANSYQGFFAGNGWLGVLAPLRTIIGVDQRGHGESDKPHDPAAYTAPVMAGDVVALLDHLGVGQADLFGYSMGGLVTARMLVQAPERVSAAVLGGVGPNLFDPDSSALDALYAPMIDALLAENPEDIEIEVLRAVRDFYVAEGNDLVALAAWLQAEHFAGAPEELAGLTVPVLVVNGEADTGGPDVAAAIPGAQLEMIPGTNHLTVVPDKRFKDRVLRFLSEIDAA